MIKKTAILILLLSAACKLLYAQPDSTYNMQLKSIQLFTEGWELAWPVIEPGTNQTLKVVFDDLAAQPKDYWYKIVHCNANWKASDLDYADYIDGYWHNPVRNIAYSTNTAVPYIHYSFSLPNENLNIKISGNYLLIVFENNDESKIAFTRKFYVTERQIAAKFTISRPQLPRYMQRYQQYWLEISPLFSGYLDLKEEMSVHLFQNMDPATQKIARPTYLENGNRLVYDDPDSNLFYAINEFRNFDTKSIKYQSPRIKKIWYNINCFNVELHPDEWRNKKLYFTDNDINGRYYIENSRGLDKSLDADYTLTRFTLPSKFLDDGDVYIVGELTGWKRDNSSKMTYNFNTNAYEHSLLLKQGYYNYQYVFKSNYTGEEIPGYIEGLHYETENDYVALVYFKGVSARYERLVGIVFANSIKK